MSSLSFINKKAKFEYQFLDTYIAGISLKGSEIKSIRQGKVTMTESYCYIEGGEAWLLNMHIAEYDHGGFANHEPLRKRKLLLRKQEIKKIVEKLKEQGITIVPYKLFIDKRGFAKLEIALAKGKKLYDKRQDIKERESKRMLRDV